MVTNFFAWIFDAIFCTILRVIVAYVLTHPDQEGGMIGIIGGIGFVLVLIVYAYIFGEPLSIVQHWNDGNYLYFAIDFIAWKKLVRLFK